MIALVLAVRALLQFGRIHRERVFVHIHKHRLSSAIGNGLDCGEECVRDSDYFIALLRSQAPGE